MWIFVLLGSFVLLIASIIIAVIAAAFMTTYAHNGFIAAWVVFVLFIVLAVGSVSAGVRNYGQIPRIRQDINLDQISKRHYKIAMGYNLGDETNERKSASHVRRFRNGDFSESKDNKTWKQNYDDWFYNKSMITYHKMQLKYYNHPIRNWRDGAGMHDFYRQAPKPDNYEN